MSLADLLVASDAGGSGGDGLLVHAGGRDHSRDAVVDLAVVITDALAAAGVKPGQAVGVMLPNGVELIATLFGVWRHGAIYVPVNPRLTAAELEGALAAVEPAALVTTGTDDLAWQGVPVVTVDTPRPEAGLARLGARSGVAEGRSYDPDVALVQFTSGTTGRPKPVLLTHSGVVELLDGVLAKLRGGAGKQREAERPAPAPMPNLIPVSLSLWAGLYNVLFALRVGAPVIVMDGFDPVELVELVRRFEIRSTVLPPAAMAMLVDDERVTDLAPLRYVRSITAPLSPLQARRFKDRFGIAVLNSYGQTEIGGEVIGWNAADSREHGEAKLGSVGRPHRDVEVRVVEVAGDALVDLPAGEAGELWLRTPAMSAGYADGADLDDRLSPDGWFRTGDIAHVDADGFVWIEGRVSDMVNRGGLKVHPAEVEEVLRTSPDVADAAVFGIPDERLGEVPWAAVEPAAHGSPEVMELTALCRDHLSGYKVPVGVTVIDTLPRNEVGKVLKRPLAESAIAEREAEPTDPRVRDES